VFQHYILRSRVTISASPGFDVHRAEVPLPYWVLDTGLESPFLLLLADLEPELDENDPAVEKLL